tara:strand:+ start:246 stop:380 length:135 start_codon:yes stop_codon:yes gene_type:complete
MITKEKKQSWSDLCYKTDPELKAPVPTYVFRDGKRTFYAPKRKR